MAQPEKINHLCGFCGKDSWFWEKSTIESSGRQQRPYSQANRLHGGTEDIYAALYQCGGCERCSIVYFTLSKNGNLDVELVLPSTRAESNEWLPPAIDADRQEAWNCYHAGLNRASILMARTTLQRAARHLHKFEGRTTLEQELDKLLEESIINKDLRENADEVRLTGNDVAHPSEMGDVSKEDAYDSLVFLEGFLETTISIPERRRKRQVAREKR